MMRPIGKPTEWLNVFRFRSEKDYVTFLEYQYRVAKGYWVESLSYVGTPRGLFEILERLLRFDSDARVLPINLYKYKTSTSCVHFKCVYTYNTRGGVYLDIVT